MAADLAVGIALRLLGFNIWLHNSGSFVADSNRRVPWAVGSMWTAISVANMSMADTTLA